MQEVEKRIKELRKILSELKNDTLSLSILSKRALAVSEVDAGLKQVKKQILKVLRKSRRPIVRIKRDADELLKNLSEFYKFIPQRYIAPFKEPSGFAEQIELYTNKIIAASGRRAELYQAVKKAIDVENINASLEEFYRQAVLPYQALVKEVDDYLEDSENEMIDEVSSAKRITVDIDSDFRETVIVDTSYLKEIEGERLRTKKTEYSLNLPKNTVIPRRVIEELSRVSKKFGRKLVSNKLVSYLEQADILIIKITIDRTTGERIKRLWFQTKKFSRTSSDEVEWFLNTADAKIIGYILRNPRKKFLILTEDNDIIGIVKLLQEEGFKVRTEGFKQKPKLAKAA